MADLPEPGDGPGMVRGYEDEDAGAAGRHALHPLHHPPACYHQRRQVTYLEYSKRYLTMELAINVHNYLDIVFPI